MENVIKYQGIGTGRFNQVIIGKGKAGWYVTRANPFNISNKYFETKDKAVDFAIKWMKKTKKIAKWKKVSGD